MRKINECTYIAGFDERLSQLMYDKNINAIQLGKIVNRDRKTVYKWCNGDSVPNALILMKICVFFRVSADYLLFGKSEV